MVIDQEQLAALKRKLEEEQAPPAEAIDLTPARTVRTPAPEVPVTRATILNLARQAQVIE